MHYYFLHILVTSYVASVKMARKSLGTTVSSLYNTSCPEPFRETLLYFLEGIS